MLIDKITLLNERFPKRDIYPYNLSVFNQLGDLFFTTKITFFIGENGSGKSTLLQAMARQCGIYLWGEGNTSKVRVNNYVHDLHNYLKVSWKQEKVPGAFFNAERFKHYALIIDEWASSDPGVLKYYGGETLVNKSHGECNLTYFENRFTIEGVYFLDEPESALSPKSQIELIRIIHKSTLEKNTQFFIATHSPLLLALPESKILCFEKDKLKEIKYEQTDYYQLYFNFLKNPSSFLNDITEVRKEDKNK